MGRPHQTIYIVHTMLVPTEVVISILAQYSTSILRLVCSICTTFEIENQLFTLGSHLYNTWMM